MVHIRLIGTIREAAGKSELSLESCEDIKEVMISLVKLLGDRFEKVIYDQVLNNPLPNVLILLNGIEVNNLNGLKTKIHDKDTLVLLSVTHGG